MSDSILRTNNLHKTLGGKKILKGISLSTQKGELKALIGPSGGGKSTLLQCLNCLLVPDEGEIFLGEKQIDFHNKKDLCFFRQKVGMIFQDFNLFDHLSAEKNVAIALRKVKNKSQKEALYLAHKELEQVGLLDKAGLYPAELSGGQKQRVSIARALAMQPDVLLLDEPTSALDPELVGEVLQVIRHLAQNGMTMIMATHQMGFVRSLADEIYFMEQGEIIECNTPDSLLASKADGTSTRTRDFCYSLTEFHEDEK